MTDEEALAEVKRLAGGNQIRLSYHAEFERMPLRGAIYADIKAGLVSANSATWQADRANWKVDGGVDTDGDEITIIVAIDGDVLVVTLF